MPDTNGNPQAEQQVYVFDSVSYANYGKTTGANGQAAFNLPQILDSNFVDRNT